MVSVHIVGKIVNGKVELTAEVPLPDGTAVAVTMEPLPPPPVLPPVVPFDGPLGEHPSVGMWADREDMADSAAWVRKIRGYDNTNPPRGAD